MKNKLFVYLILLIAVSVNAARYALIIGHNDGGGAVNPLKYAEMDAKRFSKILNTSGGFLSSNIITLIQPDSSQISSALEDLAHSISANYSDQNTICLLYYSGHADIDGLLLGEQHYDFKALYDNFKKVQTDVQIGIFDACYSGMLTAFKGGTRADPLFFENIQSVKGQVIIASSAAYERAQESTSLKGSVFSFHMFNGLRGSADLSGDKKVTLNEAYQYAYRKTIETSALTSGEIQHPVYKFNIQGQGDIVLTNFDQSSSGLLFDKESMGKYLVLSENYLDVFADFYKEKGREHFISLNTGKYTVIRAFQKEVGTRSVTLRRSRAYTIQDDMFEPDLLTESRIKGPVSENAMSSSANRQGVSKIMFGAGCGYSFTFGDEIETPFQDMSITAAAQWNLSPKTDFHIDINGYLSAKDVSILTAIDYNFMQKNKTRLYVGSAIGILYDYQNSVADTVTPLLSIHSGFTSVLNSKTKIGFRVPLFIEVSRTPVFRTGLEFRFFIR